MLTAGAIRRFKRIWRYLILTRAKCKCEICGANPSEFNGDMVIIEAHHLISRGKLAFCFDLNNGVCVCQDCHSRPVKILRILAERGDWRYGWYVKHRHQIIPKREIDKKYVERQLAA